MLENGQMATLNMKDILPNRFQPRIRFDEEKLNELAESIRKYGLIQPIVVRQIGTKYEIIAGERRFKASTLANKETIPAIIVTLSDRDSEEIALLENIQREDLTPIEEAVSYKRILDIGYITQEELAKKIGKSQSAIANKIRLLNLDDTVQNALLHGKISERHARSLLKLHSSDQQAQMLNRIINERLTVKMTDHAIRDLLSNENEVKEEPKLETKQEEIETLSTTDKPIRRAVPVASHKIMKVNPPKELEEQLNKKERGSDTMDIDKILEEAQDITPVEQPKPANDIADLMKQDPNTEVSPLIKSEEEKQPEPEPIVEPGKFVTPNIPVEPQPIENNQEVSQNSVSFDSIFNQTPAGMQSEKEAPAIETPSEPIENLTPQSEAAPTTPEVLDQVSNVEPTTLEQPVMNETPSVSPEPVSNTNPEVNSVPTENVPSFVAPVFNNVNENKVEQQSPASQPINPEPVSPVMPEVNPSVVQTPISEPINPVSLEPQVTEPVQPAIQDLSWELPTANPTPVEPTTNVEVAPVTPVQVEPVQAAPIQNNIPEVPVSQVQPSMQAAMPSTPIMNIPDDNIIETNNQVSPDPSMNTNFNKMANFRQVINLIRNCANEIEKLGYFIDLDEIDLNDKYEVTFKIDKE